ncbi:nucleotidyltransferase family protein [Sphingobium sp. Sx8-8]|uniref:nucleotidyltransferase family protein n=1 Tax=Sphingobium sp. Sx8-8 TaxID=2933617 RepID=UPI001F59F788|nr:nucleotidyltransferase family protein [Sphingobium sp. Sx8-8]
MRYRGDLTALILADAARLSALRAVRSLGLTDCWIAAGFVRDAVWDHLHGYAPRPPYGDVDTVWFNPDRRDAAWDVAIGTGLSRRLPQFDWSVKNQARMHTRNGDRPYRSVADAMTFWPETATAVAIRLTDDGLLEVNAPLGLEDLFSLKLAPTSAFSGAKYAQFEARIAAKGWLRRYPMLRRSILQS